MEIKSSLLNDEDFKYVKESLIEISEIDHKENFRVKTLEYINDSADNDNDIFFYDMLEFVRFLHPDDNSIAYTTPDHLIYLNCPGRIGEKIRQWDFIYDHECLHQLWDTFAVGDKIKEKHGEDKYDHKLLNYASDCIINDYLSYYRKKDMPDNLITPEYIYEQFGIKYDRKVDTQYTLYMKLLNKIDDIKKDPKYKEQENDEQGNNQNGQGKEGQGKEGQGKEGQGKEGQGKEGQGKEGQGKEGQGKEGQGKEGQGKEGQGKEGQGKESQGNDQKGNKEAQGHKAGKGHKEAKLSDADLKKIKEKADKIIEKYKNKLSGDLGTFISKCKKSVELKESGLATNTNNGIGGWNKQMNSSINTFVKKKVFQKKREYQSTYSRVKRGSGFIKYGQPIQPGRKIKEEKFTINVAFYIDRSGSMGSSINNVFKALYTIAESLKKQYSKETIVDDVTFKIYAFDTSMIEIQFGKKTNVGGGTMPFHQLLEYMKDHTKEYLINVIITDAEFDINEKEIDKFIKNIDGMIEFITNNDNATMKKLSKKYETKLNYILADSNFTI